MKKINTLILIVLLVLFWSGCTISEKKGVFEAIRESAVAKMILPDGSEAYIDSEIGLLRSFADLRLQAAPMEPSDREEDWIYRIIFNPSERVKATKEIVISFHHNYVQIGSEYYLPVDGGSFQTILDWAKGRFDYFMEKHESP